MPFTPFEISSGNYYNVPIKTFYIEDDSDVSNLPPDAPIGSIALVNKADDFHSLMLDSNGNWNKM